MSSTRPRSCPCRREAPSRWLQGDAEVVHVVRVLDQAVVDVVTDLLARGADEVDALDGLVDALAVEDATLQLLDADAEQLFVLPLDLPPSRLVLRKLLLGLVDAVLLVVDRGGEGLRLGPGALVALARACHAALRASCGLASAGALACNRNRASRRPRRSRAGPRPRTARHGSRWCTTGQNCFLTASAPFSAVFAFFSGHARDAASRCGA